MNLQQALYDPFPYRIGLTSCHGLIPECKDHYFKVKKIAQYYISLKQYNIKLDNSSISKNTDHNTKNNNT